MEEEQPNVAGRRRSRGSNATARSEALERLKALRQGGRRSEGAGLQIKMEDPIYDTVDEEEYDALVSKRREEVRGFIVDDNGLGYGDEGQEEDWSQAGMAFSSDESEGEPEKPKKKAEKKEPQRKKPSGLSAAAALMGKQRLSNMFTSSVFKMPRDDKARNLSCDSIIDDVIAEFAPDEADRVKRRRGNPNLSSSTMGSVPVNSIKSEQPSIDSVNLIFRPENITCSTSNSEPFLGDDVQKSNLFEEKDSLEEAEKWKPLKSDLVEDTAMTICRSSVKEDVDEERMHNVKEVKEEPVTREEEVFTLNAKVNNKNDPTLSATAGWQAVRSAGSEPIDRMNGLNNEEKLELVLDSDVSLPFYIIDAHEKFDAADKNDLYLIGKVKAGSMYHSCCLAVRNMQRCVYAIPNSSLLDSERVMKLEKDAQESRISRTAFRKELHEVLSGLKSELQELLSDRKLSSFVMSPVKRSYAFERSDVPSGENYVLKINYPFKDSPLPADIKGESFCALLGTNCSALELFLVKRKIKGPSWLSISKFSSCPTDDRKSWCKFEIIVDCPKDIQVLTSSKNTAEVPPLTVTAVNLKTIINEKHKTNEIVSASLISCHKAKIDTPMLASEWKSPGMLSHFTAVRKPDQVVILPMGFNKQATDINSKAGSDVISVQSSERALINRLMMEIQKLDSDVLVGHNISGFDLDVLLHRAQICKVPYTAWSKIGRMRRKTFPKLNKGNATFGSGASPGLMSCIAGRLLCDTFLCARELLKEVSYSLTQLTKTQLNKDRREITPHDIPQMYKNSESLMELIEYGQTDGWLSLELMFHLSVLPLTRQLTNISGNLWVKNLQGGRAQRVEYLLLHAFHAKKYIVPDKFSSLPKEAKVTKRKMNNGIQDKENDLHTDAADIMNDSSHNGHGKAQKGPAYSGGLVLEPKRGLYDKFVLLLDFNSLYPSIIQEYNICFTTVERPSDGSVPCLPSIKKPGVLPELLKNLVERRRLVKSWLKTASGLKAQQLDIQQQALKLTANSMYGCLGFSNSRFYAKPLAELITLQGREILQSTVDLVQNNLNLEVIYGDTDSIMIYSGLDDIAKAKAIAGKVIQEVNKKYRCLEIDLDGLYKRMLLLKKKKYASVKIQFKDGMPYEVIERKGLDMVRRDWSLLSKEIGDFCLGQIFSGGSCDDVIESIHTYLVKAQEDMRGGQIALEKYVITKTLTKPPEAYPDAKNQPHVEVALRLKRNGYATGCSAGDTIPYIICCEQGTSSSSSTGIAQRARHPDELKQDNGKWMIDIEYYLSQQIHPVVSRLCASIQGTSPAQLADCLGLDSTKFQNKSSHIVNNDPSSSLPSSANDDERYQGCDPLVLSCPSCSMTFECPTVFSSILSSISGKAGDAKESASIFWQKLQCPKCPEESDQGKISPSLIANQAKRQAEGLVSTYYRGLMMCDDETCNYTTRALNLRVVGDSERGTICPNYPHCNGRLVRQYTEADLYKQLAYFCYVLDTVRCIDKVEAKIRMPVEKELSRIRPTVQLAASTVEKIRDRCAYGWVKLTDLVVTI